MLVFSLKVWETATLEAGIIPASRRVWQGHQWERDPPAVFHSSTLSSSSCFSALSTRSVVNSVRWELDKWRWELDSREQLQANTLFPECQRGFGGDRYSVQASAVLLMQWVWMSLHNIPETRILPSPALSAHTFTKNHAYLHPFHAFPHSHTPTWSIYRP